MPSTSQKQHNLMAMVANNPAKAKELGVPQSVGKEFVKADKGIKFGQGTKSRADVQKVNKPETLHGKSKLFNQGGSTATNKGAHSMKKMASGGITTAKMGKVTAGGKKPHGEHAVQKSGRTKGTQVKMAASKPLGMKRGGKC